MADNVLYEGIRGVTDLIVNPGLVNLDFADVRAIMSNMGRALMGTGASTRTPRLCRFGSLNVCPDADGTCGRRVVACGRRGRGRRTRQGGRGRCAGQPSPGECRHRRGAWMPGQRERRRRLDAFRGWCCWTGTAPCASGPSQSSLATPRRRLRVRQVDEIISRIRDSVHPEANIIFGSTFDQTMKDRLRVSVIITGLSKPKPAPVAPNISAAALRTPATQPFTPPTAYEVLLPLPCSRPLQGPAPFLLFFSDPFYSQPAGPQLTLARTPRPPP